LTEKYTEKYMIKYFWDNDPKNEIEEFYNTRKELNKRLKELDQYLWTDKLTYINTGTKVLFY